MDRERIVLGLCLLVALLPGASHAREWPPDPQEVVLGEIGRELDASVRARPGFTGTVLVSLADTVLLARGYGVADPDTGRPCRVDTIYSLVQCSGVMVSLAALRLADEGLIDLDDPVSRYLPSLRGAAGGCTLRQLLDGTSGLPAEMPASAIEFGNWNSRSRILSIVGELPVTPPEPGRSGYSYPATSLLACVLEEVTDCELDDLLADLVWLPMGMFDTGMSYSKRLDADRDVLVRPLGNVVTRSVDPSRREYNTRGLSGASSTVTDMARLRSVFVHGDILSRASLELCTSSKGGLSAAGLYCMTALRQLSLASFRVGASSCFKLDAGEDAFVIVLSRNDEVGYPMADALMSLACSASGRAQVREHQATRRPCTGAFEHPGLGRFGVYLTDGDLQMAPLSQAVAERLLGGGELDRKEQRALASRCKRAVTLIETLEKDNPKSIGKMFSALSPSIYSRMARGMWQLAIQEAGPRTGDVEVRCTWPAPGGPTTWLATTHGDRRCLWIIQWQDEKLARSMSFARHRPCFSTPLVEPPEASGSPWRSVPTPGEDILLAFDIQDGQCAAAWWYEAGQDAPVACPRVQPAAVSPPGSPPPLPSASAAPDIAAGSDPAAPVTLSIPERTPRDCRLCGGYRQHDCWFCGGDGKRSEGSETVECPLCRDGKLPCKVCKGSRDDPDPAVLLLCPGCMSKGRHMVSPGKWSCPSCNGFGHYEIIGGAKDSKCAVCKGARFFDCAICGGDAVVPRLFPHPARPRPEAWSQERQAGIDWIREHSLGRDGLVSVLEIERAAPAPAGVTAIGRRLETLLERAEYLSKHQLKGSEEVDQFFREATGAGLRDLLEAEEEQLEIELDYVK